MLSVAFSSMIAVCAVWPAARRLAGVLGDLHLSFAAHCEPLREKRKAIGRAVMML